MVIVEFNQTRLNIRTRIKKDGGLLQAIVVIITTKKLLHNQGLQKQVLAYVKLNVMP